MGVVNKLLYRQVIYSQWPWVPWCMTMIMIIQPCLKLTLWPEPKKLRKDPMGKFL